MIKRGIAVRAGEAAVLHHPMRPFGPRSRFMRKPVFFYKVICVSASSFCSR